MTPEDHYREAEALLDRIVASEAYHPRAVFLVRCAAVHAQLAQGWATMLEPVEHQMGSTEPVTVEGQSVDELTIRLVAELPTTKDRAYTDGYVDAVTDLRDALTPAAEVADRG